MVLYRFGSTGVVQCLSRAAELLGLVPVFPVKNIHTFSSGTGGVNAVFRDCVLVKKYVVLININRKWRILTLSRNSTVGDVARKVMGDVPIAYVEGAGGIRVSEDEIVEVGKHDVSSSMLCYCSLYVTNVLNHHRYCLSRSADSTGLLFRYLMYIFKTYNDRRNEIIHDECNPRR